MTATTMVHIRVPEDLKDEAAEMLAAMGLTISDAVRLFLTRIAAEKALPFAIQAPNATTRAAMAEADNIAESHNAGFATAEALIEDHKNPAENKRELYLVLPMMRER